MYRARAKTKVREKRNNKSRKSGDNNNDGCQEGKSTCNSENEQQQQMSVIFMLLLPSPPHFYTLFFSHFVCDRALFFAYPSSRNCFAGKQCDFQREISFNRPG